MKKVMKATTLAVLVSFGSTFVAAPASAALISTEQSVSAHSVDRAHIKQFFDRADVAKILESKGVTPEMAKARVDSMTDEEAQQLAQKIDTAPAGAGIIEVAFTVFVILLITDILGFTKVFSFTRPVR